jgi:NADPH2:quinone reductase
MMKTIKIEKFGGPEVLEIKDIEIGKPGPKEVLIKNLSIGLNYIDIYHRTGLYPIPLPSGIGLEACGIIEWLTLQCQLEVIQKNNYFLKKS